jgi:hypothetical protein
VVARNETLDDGGYGKSQSGGSPMAKKKPQRTWMSPTSKKAKSPLSKTAKDDLDAKANRLVEDMLKPKYVEPPPENLAWLAFSRRPFAGFAGV